MVAHGMLAEVVSEAKKKEKETKFDYSQQKSIDESLKWILLTLARVHDWHYNLCINVSVCESLSTYVWSLLNTHTYTCELMCFFFFFLSFLIFVQMHQSCTQTHTYTYAYNHSQCYKWKQNKTKNWNWKGIKTYTWEKLVVLTVYVATFFRNFFSDFFFFVFLLIFHSFFFFVVIVIVFCCNFK